MRRWHLPLTFIPSLAPCLWRMKLLFSWLIVLVIGLCDATHQNHRPSARPLFRFLKRPYKVGRLQAQFVALLWWPPPQPQLPPRPHWVSLCFGRAFIVMMLAQVMECQAHRIGASRRWKAETNVRTFVQLMFIATTTAGIPLPQGATDAFSTALANTNYSQCALMKTRRPPRFTRSRQRTQHDLSPTALWRFGQILTARIAREQRSSACLRPPQMNVRETAALCPAVNLWHIISLRMTMLGQCKMLLPLLATSSVASSQAVPGRWSLCATHLPQSGRPCQDYDPCNPGWHSGSLDR